VTDPAGVVINACRVTPNPVGVGADYTVTYSSLAAGQHVLVAITDGTGHRPRVGVDADATGTASFTTQSSVAGSSVARFFLPNQTVAVARCSFLVGSDHTAPSVPSNLHTVTTTDSTIALAWDPSTDDVAVRNYAVYRDGNLMTHVPAATPSFTDTGVWPHSTHTYYVTAIDTSGNASAGTALLTAFTLNDLTAPSTPTGLTAHINPSPVSVALAWNASTDDVHVDHYDVWRAINGSLINIGSSPTTSYTDTTVPADARCSYFVEAVDEFANQSGSSSTVLVVTDVTPPTTPEGLHVTAVAATSVSLAWTASTDNFSVSSYDVFRNGTRLTTVASASGTVYWDGSVSPATMYSYYVVAHDPSGNFSAPSATVTTTTSP
jgi:chitodextrinase